MSSSPSTGCCNEQSRSLHALNQEAPPLSTRPTGLIEYTISPRESVIVMTAGMKAPGEGLMRRPIARSVVAGCGIL